MSFWEKRRELLRTGCLLPADAAADADAAAARDAAAGAAAQASEGTPAAAPRPAPVGTETQGGELRHREARTHLTMPQRYDIACRYALSTNTAGGLLAMMMG